MLVRSLCYRGVCSNMQLFRQSSTSMYFCSVFEQSWSRREPEFHRYHVSLPWMITASDPGMPHCVDTCYLSTPDSESSVFFKPYFLLKSEMTNWSSSWPCGLYKPTPHLCCDLQSTRCCLDLCDQSNKMKTFQLYLALVHFYQVNAILWTGCTSLWLLYF